MPDDARKYRSDGAPDPGAFEREPPPDAIRHALRRIRTRRNDTQTVNELVQAMASFVRGIATLLGSEKYMNGGRRD